MSMMHLVLFILTKQIQWNYWMVPFVSHGQKCHVALSFDDPNLTDGMVPLMTLLVSYDTDTSISGITWPKVMFYIVSIILN